MTVSRILSRRWRPVTVSILAACALAGCGSSANKANPTAAAALSPVTIETANGIPIAQHPTRSVSLSPSATEDLYAVGAGKLVVAVDRYSTYPANTPRTNLSEDQPNVEAIAGYRPDLVVLSQNVNNILALLGKLEPPPTTLQGAYASLQRLGTATGHAAQAARVATGMRTQVAAIASSVPRSKSPLTVYHELDQTFFSASSHTFIGQIYSLFGMRNVADQAGGASAYPQLSSEHIIAADPNLIVLADTVCCGQSYRTVARRPGWSHIAAVKDHTVLAVNDSIASEWGPRIVSFVRSVADEVRRLEPTK